MRNLMAASREELIAQVIQAQQQVAHAMLLLAEPNWVALDLTLTQLKSLIVLTASGFMPIHRLADMLHLQRSATSTLVDQLVRMDLLTRATDPEDRRRTLVDLTSNGQALVAHLRLGREEKMRTVLSHFPDDDLATIVRILRTFAQLATGPLEPTDSTRPRQIRSYSTRGE
jgi:DNA-binding MarR family transcriptional regulator